MADHTHCSSLRLQPLQGVNGKIEAIGVQRPKPFIDEQGADKVTMCTHARKGQSERQRNKESFATRQRTCRAAIAGHVEIDDEKRQVRRGDLQLVPRLEVP